MSHPFPSARLRTRPPHRPEPSGAFVSLAVSIMPNRRSRIGCDATEARDAALQAFQPTRAKKTSDRPEPACPLSHDPSSSCPLATCARNVHRDVQGAGRWRQSAPRAVARGTIRPCTICLRAHEIPQEISRGYGPSQMSLTCQCGPLFAQTGDGLAISLRWSVC
jgi:hypothetical protein